MDRETLRGRIAFAFALGAVVYSVALIAWVVGVPSIDGQTLLSYGGPLSLVITAQSLPISLLVFMLLRRRCTAGSVAASDGAWILGWSFFTWSIFGGFTVAAGALPAAALLLISIGMTPIPAPRTSRAIC